MKNAIVKAFNAVMGIFGLIMFGYLMIIVLVATKIRTALNYVFAGVLFTTAVVTNGLVNSIMFVSEHLVAVVSIAVVAMYGYIMYASATGNITMSMEEPEPEDVEILILVL